jgi:hypothetical protein
MRHVALAVAIALQFTSPFTNMVNAQTTAEGSQSAQGASGTTPQQPQDARQSGQAVSGTASQQPQTASTQAGIEGRQFGQHVSGMAPEHPLLHGVLFGECVSELAITGECPHDHE